MLFVLDQRSLADLFRFITIVGRSKFDGEAFAMGNILEPELFDFSEPS
jgi:hypothetical protein